MTCCQKPLVGVGPVGEREACDQAQHQCGGRWPVQEAVQEAALLRNGLEFLHQLLSTTWPNPDPNPLPYLNPHPNFNPNPKAKPHTNP